MKLARLGPAMVAVAAIVSLTPALAQSVLLAHPVHALHPKAVPAVCVLGDADASANWVTGVNHFHQVLDLHTEIGLLSSGAVVPNTALVGTAIAGADVHGLAGFSIGNFAFDYKTDYCDGGGGLTDHFFFVSVANAADNELFFAQCDDFPITGTLNTWHHERFTNDIMDFPHGSTFGNIFIGIFNQEEVTGSAQVKNITVNDVACDDVLSKEIIFCPQLALR